MAMHCAEVEEMALVGSSRNLNRSEVKWRSRCCRMMKHNSIDMTGRYIVKRRDIFSFRLARDCQARNIPVWREMSLSVCEDHERVQRRGVVYVERDVANVHVNESRHDPSRHEERPFTAALMNSMSKTPRRDALTVLDTIRSQLP